MASCEKIYKCWIGWLSHKTANLRQKGDKLKGEATYGEWAFLGGVIIAVILGIGASFMPSDWIPVMWGVLAALGLIVGIMNITEKEVHLFLIATIALLAVANSIVPIEAVLRTIPAGDVIVTAISGFMSAVVAFVGPAAFIVALKAIYELGKTE